MEKKYPRYVIKRIDRFNDGRFVWRAWWAPQEGHLVDPLQTVHDGTSAGWREIMDVTTRWALEDARNDVS